MEPPARKGRPWGFRQLHAFTSGTGDGCTPLGGLVADPSGTLYGTTRDGGESDGGTVFSLTPPAAGSKNWTEAIIYSFTQVASPTGSLIRDANGVLYGTASTGGVTASGTVFELVPPSKVQSNWAETTLYSFQGGADGKNPASAVVEDSTGALYGTTYSGGTGTVCMGGQGCGTAFELTPPAAGQTTWTETVLYSFTGGADGSHPYAGLVRDKSGALYGATVYGGDLDVDGGVGVIFKLTPPAIGQTSWTESVVHAFQGTDGGTPYGTLVMEASGALLGTTNAAGSGCCGTAFKLTPPRAGQTDWKETALYNFLGGSDGRGPFGGLVRDAAKNLFGTTSQGGAHGAGTVFEITP